MTIVVGYTPRPESETALQTAIDWARTTGADLVVVNGSHGEAYTDPRYARQQDLQRLKTMLERSGVAFDLRQVVDPDGPAQAIITAAEETDATLVVIGSRHRSRVGKLLLGSVAQTVILNAPCSVLTVKEHHED